MKKAAVSVLLFVAVFVLTYLALCYMVPGLRIKLAADAFTYFIKSISSMAFFKSVISLVPGAAVSAIYILIANRRR